MALLSYQESRLEGVVEDYNAGLVGASEALIAVVRDDEVLQEVKARNAAVVDFLGHEVAGLLDVVAAGGPEAGTATEILCADLEEVSLADHLDVVFFRGLLGAAADSGAAAGRWERIAASAGSRHRASIHRLVADADLYGALVDKVHVAAVARTASRVLDRCRDGLDPAPLAARMRDTHHAAQVLLDLGLVVPGDDALVHLALAVDVDDARGAAVVAVARRALPDAPDDVLHHAAARLTTLLRPTPKILGLHKLEAARLVADVVARRRGLAVVEPAIALLDAFFALPQHALLHREVLRLVTAAIDDADHNNHADVAERLFLDADLLDRAPRAAADPRASSLKAHALLICEALAHHVHTRGLDAPLPRALLHKARPRFDAFLLKLADVLSKTTVLKQKPAPDDDAAALRAHLATLGLAPS